MPDARVLLKPEPVHSREDSHSGNEVCDSLSHTKGIVGYVRRWFI